MLQDLDFLVTRHSNLGDMRFVFHLVQADQGELQRDEELKVLKKVFTIANQNKIKSLAVSLDTFFSGSSQTKQVLKSLKDFGEPLNKLLLLIKRELQGFAHSFPHNHFLKKIIVFIPAQNLPNAQLIFDKS